jgi:hypothetical protein
VGVVCRARNPALGHEVALKVTALGLAQDPGFAERFRRESRLAAQIEHPNLVPVSPRARTAGGCTSPDALSTGSTSAVDRAYGASRSRGQQPKRQRCAAGHLAMAPHALIEAQPRFGFPQPAAFAWLELAGHRTRILNEREQPE